MLAIGPNLLFCVWSRMLSIPFVRRGNNTNRKQCKYIWGNSTNTIGETIQIGNNADLARHPLKRVLSGEGWSLSHEHIRLLFHAKFFISAKTSIYSELHVRSFLQIIIKQRLEVRIDPHTHTHPTHPHKPMQQF